MVDKKLVEATRHQPALHESNNQDLDHWDISH